MGNWDNHWPCSSCGSYSACNCEAEMDAMRAEREAAKAAEKAAELAASQAARQAQRMHLRPSVEASAAAKYCQALTHAGVFRRWLLRRRMKVEIERELERLAP